jgi:hypothetical protein
MRPIIKNILFSLLMILFFGDAKAQNNLNVQISLTEIDFNYLNKGFWELASNGYMPREDLKMIKLYGAKHQQSEWYFMFHKVCKNGLDLGYVITGKPTSASAVVYNLFFLKQSSTIVTNHNNRTIDKLSILGVDKMFLFQSTTINKYNLDSECDRKRQNTQISKTFGDLYPILKTNLLEVVCESYKIEEEHNVLTAISTRNDKFLSSWEWDLENKPLLVNDIDKDGLMDYTIELFNAGGGCGGQIGRDERWTMFGSNPNGFVWTHLIPYRSTTGKWEKVGE